MIHELGHYLTARIFDVAITEFSIGMGPKIFSKVSPETGIRYSLRALPIGGFVNLVGEKEESDDERALPTKPIWQRIIIMSAGSVSNLLVGFILAFCMVLSAPALGGNTVAQFDENAASAECGLAENDRIVRVGKAATYTSDQVVYEIGRSGSSPGDITVVRDGKRVVLNDVKFGTVVEEGIAFGQIDFKVFAVDKNVGNVIKHSFFRSTLMVKMIWQSIGDLLTGRYGVEQLSGPVGVTEAISTAAKTGSTNFLYLCALIAVNLGVFNLLPIPALDGSHIVFLLIEWVYGKPVPTKYENAVHLIGMAALLTLMLYVTLQDIGRLF
ncbi:MAG: site-2 protease family protein [Clostridia bacterium]|nr:site-2 protease family protein [Clostridia bacterium]